MVFFLQAADSASTVTTSVFGVSPTTVYGVLAGLLFLAVVFLMRQLMQSHQDLLNAKNSEIDKLVDENKELNRISYELSVKNNSILEGFRSLLGDFIHETKKNQSALTVSIQELTQSTNRLFEFNKGYAEGRSKTTSQR